MASCVLAGPNLDQLIIATAGENTDLEKYPQAGMTFIAEPGVRGQKTNLFGA